MLPWFKLVRSTSHLQAITDWCCYYYFVRNSLVALLEALCARDNRDSALDHTVKLYTNCRNRRLPSPPPCFFQISYVFLLSVSMKYVARKYMFYILINMNSHHQYLILLIFLSKQYAYLSCGHFRRQAKSGKAKAHKWGGEAFGWEDSGTACWFCGCRSACTRLRQVYWARWWWLLLLLL